MIITYPDAPTPRLSWHAQQRMQTLQIPRPLIDNTLANPELTWPGRHGCVEIVGEHIIITLAPADNLIVTVKLRTTTPYRHGQHHLNHLP